MTPEHAAKIGLANRKPGSTYSQFSYTKCLYCGKSVQGTTSGPKKYCNHDHYIKYKLKTSRLNSRPPDSEAPLCACAAQCGERVAWNNDRWRWNTLIRGHKTKEGREILAALRRSPEDRRKNSARRSKWLAENGGYRQTAMTDIELKFYQLTDARSFKYIGCFPDDGSNDHNKRYEVTGHTADFVSWTKRILVWIDGCYYHECPKHGQGKFPKRRSIDQSLTRRAQQDGWRTVRIFGCKMLQMNYQRLQRLLS